MRILLKKNQDLYLYYFLLRYPGRSLVFLSSIDGIRRLLPLCTLLQLDAYPLHSHLQQRQRLKNLDRFRSNPNAILLATDVAARGLDIPEIDHVIHYQIPRSADAYIHRNGRTARAAREGFSLLMCAPNERKLVKALMTSLDRGVSSHTLLVALFANPPDGDVAAENDIPEMPVELDLLDKLKARVQLAKKIDLAAHRTRKEKHEKNWLKEAAEAMEIELDSDLDSACVPVLLSPPVFPPFTQKPKTNRFSFPVAHSSSDENSNRRRPNGSDQKTREQTRALKSELSRLLAQPLIAQGVMKKYITSGTRDVAAELLASPGASAFYSFPLLTTTHLSRATITRTYRIACHR